MNFFKKLAVYKAVNILLLLLTLIVLFIMYVSYDVWCSNEGVYCYYNFYDAFYNPLYSGLKILAIILTALLFVQPHIFRKWLFYVAPLMLLFTINRVMAVSVYTSSIGSIDKTHMAQICMYIFGVVTAIFVAGYMVYDRKKRKSVKS